MKASTEPQRRSVPSQKLMKQALAQIPEAMKSQFGERIRGAGLIGSPNTIRKRLAEIEAAGVQELIIAFVNRTNLEQIRFFAKEFIA